MLPQRELDHTVTHGTFYSIALGYCDLNYTKLG
jgi:hypothetical protein